MQSHRRRLAVPSCDVEGRRAARPSHSDQGRLEAQYLLELGRLAAERALEQSPAAHRLVTVVRRGWRRRRRRRRRERGIAATDRHRREQGRERVVPGRRHGRAERQRRRRRRSPWPCRRRRRQLGRWHCLRKPCGDRAPGAARPRLVKGRLAAVVKGGHVGAVREQQIDHAVLAEARGDVQRRRAARPTEVHVHALCKQRGDGRRLARAHGVEELPVARCLVLWNVRP